MWDDGYPEEWQDRGQVEFDRGIRKLSMIDLTDSHYDLLTDIRDRERDGEKRMLVQYTLSGSDYLTNLGELEVLGLVSHDNNLIGMGWVYIPTFLGHVALAAWEARQCPST